MTFNPENIEIDKQNEGDNKVEKPPTIVQAEKEMKIKSSQDSLSYIKAVGGSMDLTLDEKTRGEFRDSIDEINTKVEEGIGKEAQQWVDSMHAEKKEYLLNTFYSDYSAQITGEDPASNRKRLAFISDIQDLQQRKKIIDDALKSWYRSSRREYYISGNLIRMKAYDISMNPKKVKRMLKETQLDKQSALTALDYVSGQENKTPFEPNQEAMDKLINYINQK